MLKKTPEKGELVNIRMELNQKRRKKKFVEKQEKDMLHEENYRLIQPILHKILNVRSYNIESIFSDTSEVNIKMPNDN